MSRSGRFHRYLESVPQNALIVQPRMGFSDIRQMRAGLVAVRDFKGWRVGTMTIDSLTRQRKFAESMKAVAENRTLNGYPIVAHGSQATRRLLKGVANDDFPVQVRHGSPQPQEIFESSAAAGIDAIEGGPVSYCLPYGRVALKASVSAWARAVSFWAEDHRGEEGHRHIESFAGCMLGQMCPPSLLVALSVLEGLFFFQYGCASISLSLSQGTNTEQDIGALVALRRLATERLRGVSWHLVFYTWMGVFPRTVDGARAIIGDSARIAKIGGARRLVVKTAAEAFNIPTKEENVQALGWASAAAKNVGTLKPPPAAMEHAEQIYREASRLIDATADLDSSIAPALIKGFQRGYLDLPFCIHADNRNRARGYLDPCSGTIEWETTGNLPISLKMPRRPTTKLTSSSFLTSLNFNRTRYDGGYYGRF